MIWPLYVLALGAILAGYINLPKSQSLGYFLGHSPSFVRALQVARGVYGAEVAPEPFGIHDVKDPAVEAQVRSLQVNMMIISGLIALLGVYLAYLNHLKDRRRAELLATAVEPLTRAIEHKYWIDEIYQNGIVEPLRRFGRALAVFDQFVIDGIVNAVGFIAQLIGVILRLATQRGYLQGYALTMLLGIAVILILFLM